MVGMDTAGGRRDESIGPCIELGTPGLCPGATEPGAATDPDMSWAVISRYLCRRLPGGVLPPAATSAGEGRGAEAGRGGSGLLPSEGKLAPVSNGALLPLCCWAAPAQKPMPPVVCTVALVMGGACSQPATWLA